MVTCRKRPNGHGPGGPGVDPIRGTIVIPQEWTGCRTREDRESETTIIVGVVGIDQGVGLSFRRDLIGV